MSTPDWTDGVPRLVIELCGTCNHRWYLRRDCCPECGSRDVGRRISTGRGVLAALTVVHTAGDAFAVCLVDLDDGVRVMGRCDAGLALETAVTAEFRDAVPHFVARRRGLRGPNGTFVR